MQKKYIDMFSLDFREFLRSSGVGDEIIEELREHFLNRTSVPWAIHDKIMESFRLYIILGGTARKFGSSIDWLKSADLIKCVHNISGYDIPLGNGAITDNFRVYPTDIGLLMQTVLIIIAVIWHCQIMAICG